MILKANQLFVGDGKEIIPNGALVIKDNLIAAVGPFDALKSQFPNEPVTDYGDATIMPGLIEMHYHTGYYWTKSDKENYTRGLVALMTANQLNQAFSLGVTTIRDVASPRNLCNELNTAQKKGYIQIPRLLSSNVGICMTGGHAWMLDGGVVEADSPWAVRKAIRENVKEGADWIKILTSHRTPTPEYTQEELDAAVDECHRLGRKVAVHAGTQPSIEMAINAGFDTIEHGTYLTVDQAKRMKEKGITWVPTIIAYGFIDALNKNQVESYGLPYEMLVRDKMDEALRYLKEKNPDFDLSRLNRDVANNLLYFKEATQTYRENFKKLADTGVNIAAGTDMVAEWAPMTPIAEELEYMVQYGLSVTEALYAATGSGAKALGISAIGLLKPGCQADIFVCSGDATTDIKALKSPLETFLGGKSMFKQ